MVSIISNLLLNLIIFIYPFKIDLDSTSFIKIRVIERWEIKLDYYQISKVFPLKPINVCFEVSLVELVKLVFQFESQSYQ